MSSTNNSDAIRTSSNGQLTCGVIFDAASPVAEIAQLQAQAAAPDFWNNHDAAQGILQRRQRLQEDQELAISLKKRSDDLEVLVDWAGQGESVGDDLTAALDDLSREVEAAEIKKMLSGEHDRCNAIVTIHPGAGGTESQDWAEMLLRTYLRWVERRGFTRDIIDYQPGDEAGIKAATVMVKGDYAYGLLLAEAGVHRLVRISPFDQAARRHTSFRVGLCLARAPRGRGGRDR